MSVSAGLLSFFLLLPASGFEDVPASEELLQIRTLIQANALELAQNILEEEGPGQIPDGAWLNWERQLWALYRGTLQWRQLIRRAQEVPPAFPMMIRREAEQQAIEAYIALGEGDNARRLIRGHLLLPSLTELERIRYRRLVIDSYLSDQRLEDAMIAVRVFQTDYRPQDREWLLLAGGIALNAEDPSETIRLLAPLDEPEARILLLLARFREESEDGAGLMKRASAMLEDDSFQHLQKPLLAVMAEAAGALDLFKDRVDLLERYLIAEDSGNHRISMGIPRFHPGDLIDSYRVFSSTLPIFDDHVLEDHPDWNEFLSGILEEDGLSQRSLLSSVVMDVQDPELRFDAMNLWVDAAINQSRWKLVPFLFGEEAPMGELHLRPHAGLDLSYRALDDGDYDLAAMANLNISAPPDGTNPQNWFLYTARVFILAGHYPEGIEHLRRAITLPSRLTSEQADRILQVIFLLQKVGRHEQAISLLELMSPRTPGGKYDREIPFWLAESHRALGQYLQAANLFLVSALHRNNGYDEWGRSARFHAAEVLQAANLFMDARTLIQDLLQRTDRQESRLSLQRKLEEITLRESCLTGSTAENPERCSS